MRSQTSITEAELRRAQELLSQARLQHNNAARMATGNLEAEKKRNRELETLVQQLRRQATNERASLGDIQSRCASLDGQIISYRAEISDLKAKLTQSSADATMLRERLVTRTLRLHSFKLSLKHLAVNWMRLKCR